MLAFCDELIISEHSQAGGEALGWARSSHGQPPIVQRVEFGKPVLTR